MDARAGDNSGFTLVEMLVVLAILAVAAGAAGLAMTSGRAGRLVAATADRLAADLQRTRIDAIRSGRPRSLVFEAGARRWRRDGAEAVPVADGLVLELATASEAARRGAGEASAPAIGFLPDGRSTGGRIDLRLGGNHRALVVNWLTGAVRREAAP